MAGDIVFGQNAVREALAAGRRVNRVYLAREGLRRGGAAIRESAQSAEIPVEIVPLAKMNELTGTGEHQYVAAAISPVEYVPLDTLLEDLSTSATLLVLDEVQHPKNLGMLIRTAAGAGAQGVIVPWRGGALVDAQVVRASAGALFRIPIVAVSNLAQALRSMRDADFWCYGLAADAAQDLFGVSWPRRIALVVGNESHGLRPGVRKACDETVGIQLQRGVESLNVAVAAGVALFQINATRQHPHGSG